MNLLSGWYDLHNNITLNVHPHTPTETQAHVHTHTDSNQFALVSVTYLQLSCFLSKTVSF